MTGATELLDRSVTLCRADAGRAMVAHWIGTAPFVTAVLYFCLFVITRSAVEELLLPYSLLLATLWIWMNFWHSVCCDALWRRAAGEPNADWSTRAIMRVLLTNASIQGPGAFLLIMAAAPVIPFPWAHAFLQNCHIYAFRHDLNETARLSSQQASLWPKQNWRLLLCIFFLSLIVFINVMVAIFLLAQLLNSTLGIRTALMQNRTAILSMPYLLSAACITYMMIDPVWKAGHVLRCFEGESIRTGADLRLMLRRITTVVLLAFAMLDAKAQQPPAQKYDAAVKQVMQRPEYEWTLQQPLDRTKRDTPFQRQLDAVREWLQRVGEWISEWLKGLEDKPRSAGEVAPPGAGLRWAVIAAIAICALVVLGLVIRSRTRATRKMGMAESLPPAQVVDVSDESVTPDRLPAEEWLQLADSLLQKGDPRLAARAVYLAALAQLDGQKLITLGRHKTNMEYGRELARRARGIPVVAPVFGAIVETFERSWYGSHAVDADRVLALKASLVDLRSHA